MQSGCIENIRCIASYRFPSPWIIISLETKVQYSLEKDISATELNKTACSCNYKINPKVSGAHLGSSQVEITVLDSPWAFFFKLSSLHWRYSLEGFSKVRCFIMTIENTQFQSNSGNNSSPPGRPKPQRRVQSDIWRGIQRHQVAGVGQSAR